MKISDFGSASFCKDGKDTVEDTLGTRSFFAPEMCDEVGKPYSGKKSDIWALGVTLYMFTFGCCPFQGDNLLDLFHAIKTESLKFPVDVPVTEDLKVGLGLSHIFAFASAVADSCLGILCQCE